MAIFQDLRSRFEERAATVKVAHPFDPRSYIVYAILAAALFAEAVYILLSDFIVSTSAYAPTFFSLLWMLFGGLIACRYGYTKLGNILQGLAIPPILGALTAVGTVLLTPASYPFADFHLASLDAMLGFDWTSLFSIYHHYPDIVAISRWVYASLYWQLPLVALLLFASDQVHRGWIFLTAWALASLMTAATYPIAPAVGPYVFFGITPDLIPNLEREFPWTTVQVIDGIKSGEIRDLNRAMAGLVSFPSFHFAAAAIFAWAAIPFRWIGLPIILLNIAMAFSTIVSGSHYLIDLVGGAIVAGLAIWLATIALRKQANSPMTS